MSYLKGMVLILLSLSVINCKNGESIFSGTIKPLFFSIKKGNDTIYILGELPPTASLKDLKCSKAIKNSLKESKVFINDRSEKDIEAGAIVVKYLSSSAENKKKFKPSEMLIIKEVKKSAFSYFGLKLFSNQNDSFKDLSEETQNYIMKHGFYTESKNYADYYGDIIMQIYFEAGQKSFKDSELFKIVKANKIPLLKSQQIIREPSLTTITANALNVLIESKEDKVSEIKQSFNNVINAYKSWEEFLIKQQEQDKLLNNKMEILKVMEGDLNKTLENHTGTIFLYESLNSAISIFHYLKESSIYKDLKLIDPDTCMF